MISKGLALLGTVVAIFLGLFMPVPNAPPPESSVVIQLVNASEDVATIEVLYNPSYKVDYSRLNNNRPELLDSELIDHELDGYISFSLYRQFGSFTFRQDGSTYFLKAISFREGEFDNIRIASPDQDGHILKVSDPIDISKDRFFTYGNSGIIYDFDANQTKINYATTSLRNIIIFSLFFGTGTIFSQY